MPRPFPAILFLCLRAAGAQSAGFLLVSSPRLGTISWVKLPDEGNFTGSNGSVLISSGLNHPQGLAVDQKRKVLYVADPDVQRIYSYQLQIHGDGVQVVGDPTVIVSNSEARWVSVDGVGNVFFSDEPNNKILKVRATHLSRGDLGPEVMFDGTTETKVNEPGGVVADNFNVYWTNKALGTKIGSIVKGSSVVGASRAPSSLALNIDKSYGACMALGNIFYTADATYLYGVRKDGGSVVEISGELKSPRGCAYDGDGTVFVADRETNSVYAFAGNMRTLARATLTKAFAIEDAFGLAVVMDEHSAALRCRAVLIGLLCICSQLL